MSAKPLELKNAPRTLIETVKKEIREIFVEMTEPRSSASVQDSLNHDSKGQYQFGMHTLDHKSQAKTCSLSEHEQNMFPIPMDRRDGEMVITKRPWLAHCGSTIQNASYREAPLVLFRTADLNHDEFVNLVKFATLVVVLAVGFDPKVDKG